MVVLRPLILVAAFAAAAPAAAHVFVQPRAAAAGGYEVLRFGVGHGCDGRATTAVRIEIPPGVRAARPQPKPGWTLSIDQAPDDPDRVAAITWTGELPAGEYDEFLVMTSLPAEAGPLAFPSIQACGDVQVRWGETAPGSKRPAPVVVLTPHAPPEGGHDHH
jgi:uncharacterized protein YcnI